MAKTERILVFNNEIEARLLGEILLSKGIPHIIRSFHDSAYDGLFQLQSGWGVLESPENFRDEIMKIYNEMISSENRTETV